ncbi:MAG TPA: zinc-binding dehydrogenase [Steroidobacteraceae bacterium]|nr:zinc-binding dehydrogenase [Steroidobacteraceae bacterium]
MKVVEVPEFGGPQVLTIIERPTPSPAKGTLLIEVKAAGVNYSDVMARSGFYPQIPRAPFALGFEVAGVVKAVGPGVDGFKEGDPVAAIVLSGGGYATHVVVPAQIAIPLPPGLDFALATGALVQGLAAYMLIEEARVKEGDAILISAAAGGVGSIAVQIAKTRGAKVIGLASRSKFELLTRLGADHAVDYDDTGWSLSVRHAVGDHGLQVYLDSIGDLTTGAFPLLSHFGQWIIFGVRSASGNPLPPEATFAMIEKNITLRGFNLEGSLQHVPRALGDLFKWIAEGSLKVEVTKYALDEAAEVHKRFEGRKTTGKVVLIP